MNMNMNIPKAPPADTNEDDTTTSTESKTPATINTSASNIATPATTTTTTTTTAGGDNNGGYDGDNDDEMLLVTEFPPPPYYYSFASQSTPAHQKLKPPPIPHQAFKVAAKRVLMERQKAREESDRIRLDAEGVVAVSSKSDDGSDNKMDVDKLDTSTAKQDDDNDDDSIDPDGSVVAVFGEIVEDPTLIIEEECHDPVEIRENVKRLNQSVVNGFLQLVKQLVNNPNDNK